MKSQVLHNVWCHISGEAAGKILLITLGNEMEAALYCFVSMYRTVLGLWNSALDYVNYGPIMYLNFGILQGKKRLSCYFFLA